MLFSAMCASLCACVSADPLNFAADQVEIEIFHGPEENSVKEKWGEIKMEEDRGENRSRLMSRERKESLVIYPISTLLSLDDL